MNEFQRKTWGRIYVADPEKIEQVRSLIEQLDEFEFCYLPDGFIAPWHGHIEPVYGHKFEMDIDKLTTECWQRGIWIFCVTGRRDPMSSLY